MEYTTYNSSVMSRPRKKGGPKAHNVLAYIVLIGFCLFILMPLYIVVITSFKSVQEAATVQFTWFPREFTFQAYREALADGKILRGFINTLLYYIPPTLVGLFVSSLSAYGFAKLEWKGKNTLFSIMLLTMMVPGTVTMSASYLIFDRIGWVDTPLPLMIPGMFGNVAMVFFLRQYMQGLPDELLDAAKIDGMGDLGIFFKLILPLAKPALAAQGILGFIGCYNDYLAPLLYISNNDKVKTLQLVIQHLAGSEIYELPKQMAACVVAMIPMLVIYFFFQNFILKGISMNSGLKG